MFHELIKTWQGKEMEVNLEVMARTNVGAKNITASLPPKSRRKHGFYP